MTPCPRYHPLSARAVTGCVAAAVAATAAVIGAPLMLAHAASATPWLRAEHAARVAHCDLHVGATQRKACLQAALAGRGATRLATR